MALHAGSIYGGLDFGGRNEGGTDIPAGRILVQAAGTNAVALATAGARPFGVSQDVIYAGDAGKVRLQGVTLVTSGAAFAKDAPLKSDATGKAVAAVSTNEYHLQALDAATGADQTVRAWIVRGYVP
jgi:Uncharacterized conserved protein (DUF2190)